ncbi:glycosyltransferase family 4 protein [Aliifodinibius salicampi]|uniref:Glycosyltransferase family 4 protein n=1 Tax=Fodinibius salicampi TaxID=1920655 RepID=A0ABT3PV55_9BACT|nr:glycosyltransferase family 4 protein [Fodinibius salicampi]MCW9711726.1 glycosyltransferase family 4 protein [Fodinibius salicampi]
MNILFITDNFPPEVNAPATRTYEHCKKWVELGAEVTVITCAPNFPHGEVYEGYRNKLYDEEQVDGIRVIRVWSYITANEGTISRIIDYLSFALTSFWVGLFQKTDVIIATSPQFFTTWSAFALSKLKRKPWIFELRDLWPESIKAVGAMKDGWLLSLLEKIELFLYRDADLVIPNTPAFKTNLTERGIDPDKIRVIPNGANTDLFGPRPKDKGIVKQLDLENKFLVGYLGTHGMAHGLNFILNAAADIQDENIHFLFIGDGSEKDALVKQAVDLGLENVTFHEPIPKEKVPAYLSVFDISLVPLKKNDTFKTVIPSKIFEAAAMHKPILLGVEGQAEELVKNYKIGLCFEPENKNNFLEKLYILNTQNGLSSDIEKNAKKFIRHFSRENLAEEMLEIVKSTT